MIFVKRHIQAKNEEKTHLRKIFNSEYKLIQGDAYFTVKGAMFDSQQVNN